MIKTITKNEFVDAFKEYGREYNFSVPAREALFNYFEEIEESTGEKIEMDIIAICCDYTEFINFSDLLEQYPNIASIEDLQDRTQYIPILNSDGTGSESFIIANF